MATSWVQADLDAIEKAIASGVMTVRYSNKEVIYRSMDDLMKARSVIMKALGKANATQRIFTNFSKGLDSNG